MSALTEPKSMTRAKQWSDEVEEAYRLQLAGYRDAKEYQTVQQKDVSKRFLNLLFACFILPPEISWSSTYACD
jgi:hypothetical protein